MTDQTSGTQHVSPAIQRMREKQAVEETAKLSTAPAVEGTSQAPADIIATDAEKSAEGTQEQESIQRADPLAATEKSSEAGTTLDFSTPLPKQSEVAAIDLVKVSQDAKEEAAAEALEVAVPAVKEPATNFFAIRAKEVFKKFEEVTHPNRAFERAAFAGAHQQVRTFLFDSMKKAEGKQFIEMMDTVIEIMRADRTAKNYYTSTRYFRGADKQTEAYVGLMNVLFDFCNKVNRQRLMSLNMGRILGDAKIGAKLLDYINRV
jgi:hypothetical protein